MISHWACKLYRGLLKLETGMLVTFLVALIIMAVVQIFMRNALGSGVLWAESFVRIAVLWIALIGAMIGSRKGQHITIDAFVRYLPNGMQLFVQRLTDAFTAIICFILAYYSYIFVQLEFEDGGLAFSKIPNWVCEAIIPFAFFVIASRYLVAAIFAIKHKAV